MDGKYSRLIYGGKDGRGPKRNIDCMHLCCFIGFITVFLLSSCQSSVIDFDMKTNMVYTVDNYPIRELFIAPQNRNFEFSITKVDKLEGSSHIRLDSLGDNYKIETIYYEKMDSTIMYNNIPFFPSEVYEITHYHGDAAPWVIYLITDENCKVKKVKKKHEMIE